MHPDERPAAFENILDQQEKVSWFAYPNPLVFVSQGSLVLLVGIVWAIHYHYNILRPPGGFELSSLASLGFLPLWISLLNLLRLALTQANTAYALTDRRLLVRSGLWGTDFFSISFDQLAAVEVQVNPLESSMGLGTLRLRNRMESPTVLDKMVGIENPYEVFRQVEQALAQARDPNRKEASEPPKRTGFGTKYDISRNT